ncbi:hypothetical protein [Streptomyces paludis]|uniref:hypothetical protein n=1 Tax=Streptomyces paludis TaxID=2282738 RepID=UPI0013B3D510|nr:hypothetical protein [Streptomyces paludis]
MEQNKSVRIIQAAIHSLAIITSFVFLMDSWLFVAPILAAGVINFLLLPRVHHKLLVTKKINEGKC